MTTKADTALIAPVLVQTGYGEREGQAPRALDLQQPLGTVVAGGVKHAVAAPCLVQMGHGEGNIPGKRFSHGINKVEARLHRFADGFHATLSRQLDGGPVY